MEGRREDLDGTMEELDGGLELALQREAIAKHTPSLRRKPVEGNHLLHPY
jgi:hypothetical protein